MKTVINRPWISSFSFEQAAFSSVKLDQVHKLSRNFVASLDIGCPSVRHVNVNRDLTHSDRYKQWVADWKTIYRAVSKLIRTMKVYRRTVRCPQPTEQEQRMWERLNNGSNLTAQQGVQRLSAEHLPRLQETAQVLLNARYNAKLAAAEAYRRAKAAA